ncbi:hypothetical protein [Bacillus thuringiensis]|uniref:hypothetical protein n=1 Tax=Bacillus thuringiensis TaxID=1428 RepID=UPI0018CF2629|nr:hypothetical protein [Bacillus thuringiensis]
MITNRMELDRCEKKTEKTDNLTQEIIQELRSIVHKAQKGDSKSDEILLKIKSAIDSN